MREVMLSKVADVFNGKTPSKSEKRESGHPVLKVKDLDARGEFRGSFDSFVDVSMAGKYESKWAVAGDTVILNAAHSATHVASKSGLLAGDVAGALLTGEWLVVRSGLDADPRFIYYWLTSSGVRSALRDRVKGIHLYPRDVASLYVPLPPLAEQRRIAAILDHADALRAKRRQVVAHLDSLGQSIFHEMFGNPDLRVESVRFDDVAQLAGGRNLVAEDSQADSTFRVLKISAVTTGEFRGGETKPLPLGYTPPESHLVRDGDLLMSRANTTELVGAVAYVRKAPTNVALPDKVWRFEWRDADSVPVYFHALFRTDAIRRRISRLASGTGGSMKNISKSKLAGMPLPDVPVSDQRGFAERVNLLDSQRRRTLKAVDSEDHLFASLQTRAFRGEL